MQSCKADCAQERKLCFVPSAYKLALMLFYVLDLESKKCVICEFPLLQTQVLELELNENCLPKMGRGHVNGREKQEWGRVLQSCEVPVKVLQLIYKNFQ